MFGLFSLFSSKESPSPEQLAELPLVIHSARDKAEDALATEEGFNTELREIKETVMNFGAGLKSVLDRIERLEEIHNRRVAAAQQQMGGGSEASPNGDLLGDLKESLLLTQEQSKLVAKSTSYHKVIGCCLDCRLLSESEAQVPVGQ